MNKDGIILLHGILRTHLSMWKMSRFLRKHGYKVLNCGYPSTRHSIETLTTHIRPKIDAFAQTVEGHLHFVGFSMGGLLTRAYLHRFRPQKLGRVVLLGTPNHGSEMADFVKGWWLYNKLYGPAGQQLVTTLDRQGLFGTVDYELGVIAGRSSMAPIGSRIIAAPSDGTVSIESTRLVGMKDHIVIRTSHTLFVTNKTALKQTLHFIKNGTFYHD